MTPEVALENFLSKYNLTAVSGISDVDLKRNYERSKNTNALDLDAPAPTIVDKYYGKRHDGTNKGTGWLGELTMTDGSDRTMTEFSVGVTIKGKETEIPSVVPTLTKKELDHLLSGGKVTKDIEKKAFKHAMKRIEQGLSPFKNDGKGVK